MVKNMTMNYSINQYVSISETGEIKKIIDFEKVLDKTVYYMNDNTSYGVHQLSFTDKSYVLSFFVDKNKEKILKYLSEKSEGDIQRFLTHYLKIEKEKIKPKKSSFSYIGDFFFWLTMKSK